MTIERLVSSELMTVLTQSYQVVYDARNEGLWFGQELWLLMVFPAFAIIGALLLVRKARSLSPQQARLARPAIVLMGMALATIAGGPIYLAAKLVADNNTFLARLSKGAFTAVEGTVTDFVAQRPDGHPTERFRVGSHEYEVTDSDIAPGYHRARWQGGPIQPGIRVRLADIDGRIGRVEILQ